MIIVAALNLVELFFVCCFFGECSECTYKKLLNNYYIVGKKCQQLMCSSALCNNFIKVPNVYKFNNHYNRLISN